MLHCYRNTPRNSEILQQYLEISAEGSMKGTHLGKQHSCLQDAAQQRAVERCRDRYSSWTAKNSLSTFSAGCIRLYLSSALLSGLEKCWTRLGHSEKTQSLFSKGGLYGGEIYRCWTEKRGRKGKQKTLEDLFFDYTTNLRFKQHKFQPCSLNDSWHFFFFYKAVPFKTVPKEKKSGVAYAKFWKMCFSVINNRYSCIFKLSKSVLLINNTFLPWP